MKLQLTSIMLAGNSNLRGRRHQVGLNRTGSRRGTAKAATARAGVLLLLLALPSGARGSTEPTPTKLEAILEPYQGAKVEKVSFRTLNARGKPIKPTTWRVISGTGNDRENYIVSTPAGMLVDFGGEWIRVSRNEGRTWSEVLPDPALRGMYSYEGAVALAPGGDVVGIGQDYPPMAGGALTFKYEAATKTWYYSTAKLHTPALDRPAVGVLPGPFDLGGTKVPYLSVLRGGLFAKSPWYYSLDGLNYFVPNSRLADSVTTATHSGALKIDRWAQLDWLQPHELIGITPYGRRKALAEKPTIGTFDVDTRAPRTVLDSSTLRWSTHSFGDSGPPQTNPLEPFPLPQGRTLADSAGNLHHVSLGEDAITYLLSRDGGKRWSRTTVPLLDGHHVYEPTEFYKAFRVSGERGESFVAIHVVADDRPLVTQDLVYQFSFKGRPRVKKIYMVGDGGYSCLLGGVAVGGSIADGFCDFFNVTLLPTGRIAVSFTDRSHPEPAVAVQLK